MRDLFSKNRSLYRFIQYAAPLMFFTSLAGMPGYAAAGRPQFYAVAQSGTLAIYSSSGAEATCTARVPFTYDNEKGERKEGMHICKSYLVKVGQDLELCRVSTPDLRAPRVEGPVTASCE